MLELFPFPQIRESQTQVLEEIQQAIRSGYKKIVLEASTGFGKSPVAIAVARHFRTAYICTSTINLQDQYLRDFPFLRKVIGKGNFDCKVLQERNAAGMFRCEEDETEDLTKCGHTTVDKAPCLSKDFICSYRTTRADYDVNIDNEVTFKEELIQLNSDPRRAEIVYPEKERIKYFMNWKHYKDFGNSWDACNYYHQKNIGLLSPYTIFNYAIFNSMNKVKRKTGKPYLDTKGVLILDEGHLFEQEVIGSNGDELDLRTLMHLTRNRISVMPAELSFDGWLDFINNALGLSRDNLFDLERERAELFALINRNAASQTQLKRFYSLARIINYVEDKIEKISTIHFDMTENPENWIIDRNGNKLILKPLDITKYCRELYEYGDNLFVMSATILDKDMYCKQIGLDTSEVKFISIDSDFPVENRPIFTDYVGKLRKDNIDMESTHQTIASKLNRIMNTYYDKRGLIHMPTSKLIDQILPYLNEVQRKRLYIVKSMSSKERTEMLTAFEANPRGVLISPSLYVGIDLKDDLSRFQVIVKVPYPSLGDKWIHKKYEQNKAWYNWTTLLKVVQGVGRSVRHKEDFADTYILDENFENMLRFSSKLLPKSFKDAVYYGKNHPRAQIGNKNT